MLHIWKQLIPFMGAYTYSPVYPFLNVGGEKLTWFLVQQQICATFLGEATHLHRIEMFS